MKEWMILRMPLGRVYLCLTEIDGRVTCKYRIETHFDEDVKSRRGTGDKKNCADVKRLKNSRFKNRERATFVSAREGKNAFVRYDLLAR